jgi:uncharacterized phage protein gp47/JayE
MFERQSMEQIVERMIRWTRGATDQLTDFRVGSKVRTLYEAVGVVLEELYDRVFRAMRLTIEENIYTVIGFVKEPATYASGTVRMSRTTPADTDYYIPAGTEVLSDATPYHAPSKYRTVDDAILEVGKTFVDVFVVANQSGEDSNVGAGTVREFVSKPVGIDSITNLEPLQGGGEEETKEEQKVRFEAYMQSRARGVLQSIEYGGRLAKVTSEDGTVIESVRQAVALEYLDTRRGEVDLYIWNGSEDASEALIADVQRILQGYYDTDGQPVIGYKPAGIAVNVYTAQINYVTLKLKIEPVIPGSEAELQVTAEQAIDDYFDDLELGSTFIQSELQARLNYLDGVRDVKLHVSTDGGVNWSFDNVAVQPLEIAVPQKPTQYEWL